MSNHTQTSPEARGQSVGRKRSQPTKAQVAKARADVSSGRKRPSEAAMELATSGYAEAERDAIAQRRREVANRIKELRRQADGAKERSRKAQERFESAVAVVASEKPERPDWYEY